MTTPLPTPTDDDLSRVFTLSPVRESVPVARRWVRQMLTKWRIDHFSERAELLVTELLTNALTHARTDGGTVTVLLMYAAGTLRLEVRDRDPANLPVLRNADLSEETGRGLTLIDAYADRWGYRGTEAGKAVWGELDNAPPPVARIQPLPPTRRGAGDGA